jgi:hypothetical protein
MEGLYVKTVAYQPILSSLITLYEPYKWEQYSMVKYGSGQVA